MKALILIVVLLQGCGTMYGRLGVHHESSGRSEITLQNPLGTLGYRVEVNEFRFFVEHTSGIFYREDGLGFNHVGVETDLFIFK